MLKRLAAVIAAGTMLVAGGVTAFAHGCYGNGNGNGYGGGCYGGGYGYSNNYRNNSTTQNNASYAICGNTGCELVGTHAHDGVNYYGHYNSDGTVTYPAP